MQGTPALVQTNYRVRTGSFVWCFIVVGVFLWERGEAGPAVMPFSFIPWVLMALQFLLYPHLVYWRARHSARPMRAELDNLFLDSALLGAWAAALGFPLWITYAFVSATTINAVVNRGLRGLAGSLACCAAGAGLWTGLRGIDYAPATSDLVSGLCFVGALAYMSAVGYVMHTMNRRLVAARDATRRSEERYRLIAENAGDLIAMIDPQGRWLYASPSWERVLERVDLAPGTDVFHRLHPDDAERVKAAIGNGKLKDLTLRLVDRKGRIRQYKTRIQPLEAQRVLLVSQDVTDLRESEERVLLAAHAFEGMTEAIVITAADGTVVTVNRAFCDLTGFARDEVLGQPESAIRNALQPAEFYDEVYKTVARDGYWSGTTWARRKNGAVYREWRSLRAVKDASGALTHYVIVFYEVGESRVPGDAAARGS